MAASLGCPSLRFGAGNDEMGRSAELRTDFFPLLARLPAWLERTGNGRGSGRRSEAN